MSAIHRTFKKLGSTFEFPRYLRSQSILIKVVNWTDCTVSNLCIFKIWTLTQGFYAGFNCKVQHHMDKLHGKHLRIRTSNGSNQGRISNLDGKSCNIMQTSHSRVRGIWRNQNEKGQKSSQHFSVKTPATVSLSSKEHHFVRRFRMEVIFPSKWYHP